MGIFLQNGRMVINRQGWIWFLLQLVLGFGWIGVVASQACQPGERGLNPFQVVQMLFWAGWLPSMGLALWQRRHRSWRALVLSDLIATALVWLVAFTLYLPLFFFNVVWFLPYGLLPRGLLTEMIMRGLRR